MKIVLIAPPIMDNVGRRLVPIAMDAHRECPPYGMYLLQAVLEDAGHEVCFIDLIAAGNYATPDVLIARYRLDPAKPLVVFTQHSVTQEAENAAAQIRPSLAALGRLSADGVQVIVTYPNNDSGARAIVAEIDRFGASAGALVQVHPSLGRANYHGLLALARDSAWRVCCAGNSSSGIKETPAFGCPTVNIGTRQQGRLRAENVIDAGYDAEEIGDAIRRCLFDADFRAVSAACDNPYGVGDAGVKVAEVLAGVPLGQALIRKRMMLRGEARDGWYR